MNASSKKLTTAAVCTALSVIMCVMTAYLPLSFMPLYLAAFCIFLACKRANVAYGVLSALASVGLMFLMTGLSVKWLTFVIMFAPYGILAYFIHPLNYTKVKKGLLRALTAIVYFNAMFGVIYAITVNVLTVGLDGLDIAAWAAKLGGYPVLALIATVILVPLDFIFSTLSAVVLKKIPAPVKRLEKSEAQVELPEKSENGAQAQKEKRYDDVFGYEIVDGNEQGNSAGEITDDTNIKDK